MRLAFLTSLFITAIQADPITVIQSQSAFGLTGLSYSYNVPASPSQVTATISGNASCFNTIPACSDQPASASLGLTLDLYTAGPARQGVALLQLMLTSGGNSGGATQVSGAIGPYSLSSCPIELDCQQSGYFSFELGVPFTINLSGLANGFPPMGNSEFLDSASLQLFEVPPPNGGPAGAPVQMYLVPEPGSATLAVTGLSALVLLAFRRKRSLTS